MTTLQLEYFQYLAQSLHLSHTAEHFYVSAPAVAASIKRLEAELSAELFEVQGRALKLTDAGKIFSQYVDVILSNISSAKEEISILEQKKEDTITIAIVSPVIWSQMFQDFMWRYPDIKINSTLVSVSQLHDPSVMQGFDFIFCPSSDLTSPAFDTIELPNTVETIGKKAFGNIEVEIFVIKGEVDSFASDSFSGSDVYMLYYPKKYSDYVDIVDPSDDYGYAGTFNSGVYDEYYDDSGYDYYY